MKKREEELKEAEITINAFLTIALVYLTFMITISNPIILKISNLVILIVIVIISYVLVIFYILFRKVWKKKFW